jgi:hypothetical protein
MNPRQLKLPLFGHSKNQAELRKPVSTSRNVTSSARKYYKTQQILQLFKLEKVNSELCAARAQNGAYRQDSYVAIHISHDKWEIFRRYSIQEVPV